MTFPVGARLRYVGDPIEDTSPTARVIAHHPNAWVELIYEIQWSDKPAGETVRHTSTFIDRNMEQIS